MVNEAIQTLFMNIHLLNFSWMFKNGNNEFIYQSFKQSGGSVVKYKLNFPVYITK